MGEHAHCIAGAEFRPDSLEETIGPVVHDLVGHRETTRRREDRTSVAHRDAITEQLRESSERRGEVDGAEDHHLRWQHVTLDEHLDVALAGFTVRAVVARTGDPGGQLAECIARDDPIDVGVADGAEHGAVGLDEQFVAESDAFDDGGERNRTLGA